MLFKPNHSSHDKEQTSLHTLPRKYVYVAPTIFGMKLNGSKCTPHGHVLVLSIYIMYTTK